MSEEVHTHMHTHTHTHTHTRTTYLSRVKEKIVYSFTTFELTDFGADQT